MTGSQASYLRLLLLSGAIFISSSCDSLHLESSSVQSVRNGVLGSHNATTVGKALEGTFNNPKWRTLETSKGVKLVEFTGTIKLKTLSDNGFGCGSVCKKLVQNLDNSCLVSEGLTEKYAKVQKETNEARFAYDADMAPFGMRFQDEERQADPEHQAEMRVARVKGTGDASNKYHMASDVLEQRQQELDAVLHKCLNPKIDNADLPVTFQFQFSADGKTFDVSYIDNETLSGKSPDAIMAFVYK